MAFDRIDAETDDLCPAIGKLLFQASDSAKLCSADGCKVFGVRKEDCPIIPNPLVEVNRSLCGFSGEIWSDIIDAK
jgi:hypothetical protein